MIIAKKWWKTDRTVNMVKRRLAISNLPTVKDPSGFKKWPEQQTIVQSVHAVVSKKFMLRGFEPRTATKPGLACG